MTLQSLKEELLTYSDFINKALYSPGTGYYTNDCDPVGYDSKTDFYTAQSLNTSVFNELTIEACIKLIGSYAYKDYTFVEIGSQLNNPLLNNSKSPFANHLTITPSDLIEIPSKAIVFANELLDAQPFHRLIYTEGDWKEIGVRIHPDGLLVEELLPTLSSEITTIVDQLPESHIEGYQLDLPLAAESLLNQITSQKWTGLLVLFDYGLLWKQLVHERPQGTGRSYYQHELVTDLLANPGKQDITCHICWDRLFPILEKNGFSYPQLQSQESFFMHHAKSAIEPIILESPGKFGERKQSLKQLLHPADMGQKFQVLHALKLS